jgi:hypothetical protein
VAKNPRSAVISSQLVFKLGGCGRGCIQERSIVACALEPLQHFISSKAAQWRRRAAPFQGVWGFEKGSICPAIAQTRLRTWTW